MILVDTSVWIDHLRAGDTTLSDLLNDGQVLTHPFIIGEIGLGSLKQRSLVLALLGDPGSEWPATRRSWNSSQRGHSTA